MIITFQNIEVQFDTILNSWFELYDKANVAINLFTHSMYTKSGEPTVQFLSFMQTLESFLYKQRGKKQYVDKNKFKKIQTTLLNNIPTDIPQQLTSKLQTVIDFGNTYSLRDLITEEFNNLSTEYRLLICKSQKEFIDSMLSCRNYFTHYSMKPCKHKDFSLHVINTQLSRFIIVLILAELNLLDHAQKSALHEGIFIKCYDEL